ncbi:MAG: hypothetical protein GKR95_01815 [Gammaproteobacteria bacterium]|nr:hypothetical protein [Gammaproteobacteria bacterium]
MDPCSWIQELECAEIINRAAYPVDEQDSPKRQSIVDQVRAELAVDGCAVIRNFFSEQGLAALLIETQERQAQTYYSKKKMCNVYLSDGDDTLTPAHIETDKIQ